MYNNRNGLTAEAIFLSDHSMRIFQDIIVCIMVLLLMCFGSVASGEAGVSDAAAVMAIPEMHFLSTGEDPNYVAPAKPILIDNDAVGSLIKAYKQTGDERYSRRLAVVLYRFSRDFKSLVSDANSDRTKRNAVTFEPVDGVEMVLLQAYLTVRDTAAVKKLSKEIGVDVAKAIEGDLIRAMVDSVIKEHQKEMASGNLAEVFPDYLADVGLVGRAIHEPEYVRVVCRYLSGVGYYSHGGDGGGLFFDMHSTAGQQGHLEVSRRVKAVFGAVEGYSDPVGYKDKTGRRYDDVSLEDFPQVEKMLGVLAKYALPDGQMNLLGDSAALKVCEPLEESTNVLLAGYGHAVLGAGRGGDQSQVQMHFSAQGGSEGHGDCLSLVWYAHGRQMSGEIGGQRNKLRSWSASTLSHNTVVIDMQEQSGGDTFGNVLMYVSDIKGLSVIQVDGAKAYRNLDAKKYRRTIIHNTIDEKRPYFVDVFEVEGGTTHDYSVHGSVFGDMVGQCSLSMQRMEGARPLLEKGDKWVDPGVKASGFSFPSSKYGLMRKVDRAMANKDFNVTFAYGDDKSAGTRIHMLTDPSMEIFLGETPALRLAGNYADGKVYDWKMPQLIARRSGENGLRSTFVAVYDMFEGGAKIKSVKRLISSDAYVSLKIDLGDRVDKLLYCPGGKRSMIGGGVQMKGQLGLVTEEDGRYQGHLVGGTILRKSPMMVRKKKALYSGRILTAMREDAGDEGNAFTVDTILPTGDELSGKWMIVTHTMLGQVTASNDASKEQSGRHNVTHAFEIDRVERKGVKMVVYLKEDHGLDIEGGKAKEVFSKWLGFTGPNKFVIYTNIESSSR